VRLEEAARLGQLEAAAAAYEQRRAKLRLEPADLLGQARLGHVQGFGSGGEGPVLDRGEEVFELLECHRFCLLTWKLSKPTAMTHKVR
jgi:hypothetical protein